MAFINLEPNGNRPPTEQEKTDIRAALDLAAAADVAALTNKLGVVFADTPVQLTDANKGVIFIDATLGDINIFLPPITAEMQTFVFKRIDSSVNTVTLLPHADDAGVLLETAASLTLSNFECKEIRSNTTHWWEMFSSMSVASGFKNVVIPV